MSAKNDAIFDPWKAYFWSERGKRALGLVGIIIATVVVTLPIMWPPAVQDFRIDVEWPEHLSRTHPTGVMVFAQDGPDSQTAGATIRVWRGIDSAISLTELVELEPLAVATADAAGAALIDVPPVDSDTRGQHDLVIGVETAAGQRGWVTRTIPVSSDVRIAIQTDRPLYQPGQRVHFRGLVVDSKSGKPRSDRPMKLEVRNPRGHLLFQTEATTDAAGVVSARIPLAESSEPGEYEITVRGDAVEVIDKFEVRPFQLPRFEAKTVVEDVGSWGERPARFTVSATYFYGSPVPGARSEIRLEDARGHVVDSKAGKTDAAGKFTAEFDLPDTGGSIVARGTVTSGGHRASNSARISRQASTANVEIIPAWHAAFQANQTNTAYAIVTAPDGAPIRDATLELGLPEASGQRVITLQTDSRGITQFAWTPRSHGSTITARVLLGDSVLQTSNIEVQSRQGRQGVTVEKAVVDVGERFRATVQSYDYPRVLVARNGGEVIWSNTIPAGDSPATVDIEFDEHAAGLTSLSLLGAPSDVVLVWVRASTGALDVEVTPESPEPGELATLTASLPSDTPVHYGVTAVDEALYALLERSAVPLGVLMRNDRATASMLQSAMSTLSSDEPEPIVASRFRSKLEPPSTNRGGGSSLTRDILTRESAPLRIPWAAFMVLLALAGAFMAARAVKPEIRRENFTVRRFAALAVSIIVLTAGGILLFAGHGDMFAGGLAVWTALIVWWILSAAVRNPELPLGEWLGWNIFAAVMLANASMTISPLSDWAGIIMGIGLAPALIALGIEVFLLVFVLYRRREYYPAFGLGSLFGVSLFLFLSAGMSQMKMESAGTGLMQQELAAPASMAPGSKPEPAPASAESGPRVRSWFPETMLWLPSRSAIDGVLRHQFEVPDSITTWRITTWANTDSGQFAQSDTPLVVKMPLFVQLETPTNLTDGDTVEVPVRIVNDTSADKVLPLRASASGPIRYLGGLPSTVTVGSNSQTRLTAKLRASGYGTGNVEITVGDQEEGDAVRRKIEVLPLGRRVVATRAGVIGKGLELEPTIADEAIANTGSVEVTVYPSVVGQALVGLESMLRTPTGCFEQTSSANYPNVLVMRELQNTKPEEWPTAPGQDPREAWQKALERASDLMTIGYQKMLSFRQDDGGFAFYPEYRSNVMLTAYGIMQLHAMADVLPGVDPNILREAGAFLRSRQAADGSWNEWADGIAGGSSIEEDIGQVRANAFIAYALLLTGAANDRRAAESALNVVAERLDAVESAQALALSALAFQKAERPEAAARAVDRLANSVAKQDGKTYWPASERTWMGGGALYADVETTALGTLALLRTNSHVDLLGGAVKFLAESRQFRGGWGTTQATAWALMSLAELPQSEGSVNLEIRMDGTLMPLTSVDGHDGVLLDVGDGPQTVTTLAASASAGEHLITVSPTDETAAMVSATAIWWIPWNRIEPVLTDPLAIKVQATGDARTGESLRINVVVTNQTDSGIGSSIVELPTAPGAIANTAQFERWQRDGRIDRFEVTPVNIRLYLAGFEERETKTFTYELTPLIRGSYALTTASAWRYYTPSPRAAAGGAQLRVR